MFAVALVVVLRIFGSIANVQQATFLACIVVGLLIVQPYIADGFDLRQTSRYVAKRRLTQLHVISINSVYSDSQFSPDGGDWQGDADSDADSGPDYSVLPQSFSAIPSLYGELGRPLERTDGSDNARGTLGERPRVGIERNIVGGNIDSDSISSENLGIERVDDPANVEKPIVARMLSWILKRVISARTSNTKGLDVHVSGASNQDIMKGKVGNVEMKFDELTFGNIICSGGGRLVMQGTELHMRRLFFQNLRQTYKKPYRLYGDFLLTQSDIINSKFIRRLLQLLVNTILERVLNQAVGALKVQVTKVSIRSRKLHVHGELEIANSGSSVGFEVSLGAGIRPGGQILTVRDVDVTLNPDSTLRTTFPVLLSSPIDVDLGSDFKIETLVIGNRSVWIQAVSIIKPQEPAILPAAEVTDNVLNRSDVRRSGDTDTETEEERGIVPAKRALYRYDLAAVLSAVMKLNGGLIIRWLLGPIGEVIGNKLS